ncbi:MAG TPA: hypothetical protein VNJ08_01510 [Bacteriovoracaceae bacterium]|nr:hypothetical protein [Bacteriovoracaceae bacterium]
MINGSKLNDKFGGHLNVRNVATAQDALVCQYRNLIQEAVSESHIEFKTGLNIGKLNSKLRVICKAAEYDGLPEDTISNLIDEVTPVTKAA